MGGQNRVKRREADMGKLWEEVLHVDLARGAGGGADYWEALLGGMW